jgi:hypothetical protein
VIVAGNRKGIGPCEKQEVFAYTMGLTRSDKTEEKSALNAAKSNITEKGRLVDQKLDTHTRWA